MWALVHQPLLFLAGLAVFFILALLLIVALWKFIKRVFRRPPRPRAPDKKTMQPEETRCSTRS
jgi:membrane protein implicated in regulation of membrane protease activity